MIKKSNSQKNVALYIREASDKKVENGRSLDSQLEDMKATCKRKNWHIYKVYRDEGLSDQEYPGLEQMFNDVRMGQIDIVYVYCLKRFYRHLEHLLKAMHFLRTTEVSFVSHHENLDFTTSWGKLVLTALGTLAEIYIDDLSDSTDRGKM